VYIYLSLCIYIYMLTISPLFIYMATAGKPLRGERAQRGTDRGKNVLWTERVLAGPFSLCRVAIGAVLCDVARQAVHKYFKSASHSICSPQSLTCQYKKTAVCQIRDILVHFSSLMEGGNAGWCNV